MRLEAKRSEIGSSCHNMFDLYQNHYSKADYRRYVYCLRCRCLGAYDISLKVV